MPTAFDEVFSVEQYLDEERTKDMFRFSTAGSVDDGKSTLIGRLLYDTQSVYEDQVRSIEGKGTTAPGVLDLALLTDGLRAEREQGITIDVAYRYFATARRKFLIADTPGHEQYTRNMATGASTADAAVVLVDTRKGVLRQSRRHAYIAALLGVRQVIVAVNKMDLVGWDEERFVDVREEFLRFFADIEARAGLRATLHFVPVSALEGANVVHRSASMPWYSGATLLELLEQLPPAALDTQHSLFRFAVQRVVRPNLDFRGYAGQIAGGAVRAGDTVMVLPSRLTSRVRSIVTYDGELAQATAPQSVTLVLEDELDISRGDLLVAADRPAEVASRFTASLVWMDATALELGRRYLLKHTARVVPAQVSRLIYRVDLSEEGGDGAPHAEVSRLELNGIALAELETHQPLYADAYTSNRHTGSFILIDAQTNATVGAGMIRELHEAGVQPTHTAVSAEERAAAWGHRGAQLVFRGDAALVERVERLLFSRRTFVARCNEQAAAVLAEAGALALVSIAGGPRGMTLRTEAGSESFALPGEVEEASAFVLRLLEGSGILSGGGE